MSSITKYLTLTSFLAVSAVGLGACSLSPQAQHEIGCVGGTLTGAVIGGAIGNRFGGGTGQTLATAAGAATGAVASVNAMNC
ncbi:MAG: glycine zipper 2TM domain-containing protein [Rhodobacteraceae bacterium]|nr:glycine zipper 2TM domain-containing protein [Paracoccaceae bacterium]